MRYPLVTMVVTALLLIANGSTRAQSTENLVQASLLANVSTIKTGEPFVAGVLLKIKPGWHIYWQNPGDSGLPTRVRWTLPEGFTASDLRFPVPRHIDQPGGLVIYGYTDEVMLMATITPSQSATPATSASISAKVDWLCCSEDCVPGKATVNLQLMQGDAAVPDNTPLFEQWQHRLPTITSASPSPLVLSNPAPQTLIRSDQQGTDPKSIIPGAVDGLIVTTGAPLPSASGSNIPVFAKVLKGESVTATSVPILITWPDPAGTGRLGEQINVPIVSGH